MKTPVQRDLAFLEAFGLIREAEAKAAFDSPELKERYERVCVLRGAADDPSQNIITVMTDEDFL
jgi:hypothetical protein